MGKITFRADDALISRLEEFDASKSEIMRDALREFIESRAGESGHDESRGDERSNHGSIRYSQIFSTGSRPQDPLLA